MEQRYRQDSGEGKNEKNSFRRQHWGVRQECYCTLLGNQAKPVKAYLLLPSLEQKRFMTSVFVDEYFFLADQIKALNVRLSFFVVQPLALNICAISNAYDTKPSTPELIRKPRHSKPVNTPYGIVRGMRLFIRGYRRTVKGKLLRLS